MVEKFTISTLLEKGIETLGKGDYFNPLLDAQILLSHLLGVDKIYLYTHSKDVVEERTGNEFLKLIELRKSRYPLQYIIGKQEFMGLDFNVEEGVLVPRPDTEILVESIIELVKNEQFVKREMINIADIGTGSGAITLSLAHFIENAFVYSVDISKKALQVACKNAKNLSLESRVKFLNGSVLKPLYDEHLENSIDILVSNPPYIPTRIIEELQIEVSTYEPKLALDGGEDGLDFYRNIIDNSSDLIREDGIIAFEIGHDQAKDIENLLENSNNFRDIKTITDLSGLDRVIIGKKI